MLWHLHHSLARGTGGAVVAWGWNGVGQVGDGTTVDRRSPVPVPGVSGAVAVAGGAFHGLVAGPGTEPEAGEGTADR